MPPKRPPWTEEEKAKKKAELNKKRNAETQEQRESTLRTMRERAGARRRQRTEEQQNLDRSLNTKRRRTARQQDMQQATHSRSDEDAVHQHQIQNDVVSNNEEVPTIHEDDTCSRNLGNCEKEFERSWENIDYIDWSKFDQEI